LTLSNLIAKHEDDLICDLAEYYGIYNYRDFKPFYIATLALGLRADSRVKTVLSGLKAPLSTFLMASAVDRLSLLFWAETEDGAKNQNRPPSIAAALNGETPKTTYKKFATHDEFKAAWAKATGGA